jgi:hypothetical protein
MLLKLDAKLGVAYAISVFAIGFMLGTARVLILAPRVGSTVAVAMEAPMMLAASWFMSGMWMRRLNVPLGTYDCILVGAVALATLTGLEVALSLGMFHRSMGEYVADLRSPGGVIGLAAQLVFAGVPLLRVLRDRDPVRRP